MVQEELRKEIIRSFFDSKAKEREKWIKKNSFYNQKILEIFKFHIPERKSVLEIGCGTGTLLNSVKPLKGVGIDFSKEMINQAKKKYPNLRFICADASDYTLKETFDYIIISDTVGYFDDIQKVFANVRQNCTEDTRIIINSYNALWEPILHLSSNLGLKMKQPFSNWLSPEDIANLLHLEEYEVIKINNKILIPKNIPLLSSLFNKILVNLPFFRSLCLVNVIIARPLFLESTKKTDKKVSLIIAARNEEGNVEKLVKRIPKLGKETELVFVEGGSKDKTYSEIERIAKKYSDRFRIQLHKQNGQGKGDAVRKGFDKATGDILIILDADISVPPEDLTKFYDALIENKGEFINGSRLVYPMEKDAMKAINLLGNKIFSVLFTWLLDQRFKDTLCGTKAISKKNYEHLKNNRAYFGDFDPFGDFDLIFGASKMNLKIVEVPIRYKSRTYGDTNIRRFYHGWFLLKMCFFAVRKIKFV
jgi:ubiquinone/menaquinone biosynthesis C-methylase UbiE